MRSGEGKDQITQAHFDFMTRTKGGVTGVGEKIIWEEQQQTNKQKKNKQNKPNKQNKFASFHATEAFFHHGTKDKKPTKKTKKQIEKRKIHQNV